jgi:hypothetical protein
MPDMRSIWDRVKQGREILTKEEVSEWICQVGQTDGLP